LHLAADSGTIHCVIKEIRMRIFGSLALCLALTPALLATSSEAGGEGDHSRLKVVATTGMIADAARNIGGERVEVTALMRPGIDPHAYRQTRSDIVALASADLVLWHGLDLEAQMKRFLEDLSRKLPVVAVAEGVTPRLLIEHDAYAGKYDPHLWMDPVLWKEVIANVERSLSEAHPQGSGAFRENAARYADEIDRLAAYAEATLSSIPKDRRILLTAHDAFGYFGAAYGFEVMGIQGISTDSEPGLHRIGELVDLIVEREIGAVFVESSVAERNVLALVEGAAARGHRVEVAGELFSDAMGEQGTYEGTYVGMIDHNVTLIAGALGGEVAAGGMLGKLGGHRELSWLAD